MQINNTLKALTAIGIALMVSHCSKNPIDEPATSLSISDKIKGTYSGFGKRLPDGISLGNFSGCVTPIGWEDNLIEGNGALTITKISDTTVNFHLTGIPFGTRNYSPVKLSWSNSVIDFGFGTFDTASNVLTISRSDAAAVFVGSPACRQGMPYFSGWSVLNDGNYSYTTHGWIDFEGVKQ